MNEEIFEVIDRNKAKAYEDKKQKEKQEKIEREKAMLIFGKSKSDWKALELYYRREWLCFVVGFVLGVILI
jgi:uncharacterized phosphosugar-binding protein|tara:strand:- start:262 stop:474 length:213 start_codon:yes stop_codon:yes gene_type:complete